VLNNSQIADVLEELADLLEFQGSNAFRIRAYRNAARTIRNHSESIAALATEHPEKLTEMPGIGKAVAEKCATLATTGKLPQLQELLEEIPESTLAMLRIPGLGPKKAAVLYKELEITSLDQLRVACERGEVRQLKGFAQKTEQAILDGLEIAEAANQRLYWAEVDEVARALQEHLDGCPAIEQLEFAGSYRRGKETVGDLDILVVARHEKEAMDCLEHHPDVADTMARGGTKMSVRLQSGLQVDMRVVPAESFGAALQYFTGSKEHNVVLRGRAKSQGLKINEYGVFRLHGDGEDQYVAGATEDDVYGALQLPVFPPELREARHEFEWAEAGQLPDLVTLDDIQGDLHMHTTETDGKATLEEMAEAALQRGLKYIAITDHSQRVSMARGLNPDRLLAQWEEIDQLNKRLGKKLKVLKGLECDILEQGGMDMPDDVLEQADWILASIHYGQRQSREQITDRILEAIHHPSVSAVAHPTGRLINRREPYEVDMEAVFEAAKQQRKMLELNANPARLDLNDIHCAAAKQLGIPVVIATDAHSTRGLDVMRYGIMQARRGGLTKRDVANTRSWTALKKMLGS
jgi:DNA polymerase (family 10)